RHIAIEIPVSSLSSPEIVSEIAKWRAEWGPPRLAAPHPMRYHQIMKFSVVTLFPNLIHSFTSEGLIGQAIRRGELEVATVNPRQFTSDVHHTVDDKAFGGGDG